MTQKSARLPSEDLSGMELHKFWFRVIAYHSPNMSEQADSPQGATRKGDLAIPEQYYQRPTDL